LLFLLNCFILAENSTLRFNVRRQDISFPLLLEVAEIQKRHLSQVDGKFQHGLSFESWGRFDFRSGWTDDLAGSTDLPVLPDLLVAGFNCSAKRPK
jgi:hypothetical protein